MAAVPVAVEHLASLVQGVVLEEPTLEVVAVDLHLLLQHLKTLMFLLLPQLILLKSILPLPLLGRPPLPPVAQLQDLGQAQKVPQAQNQSQ